MQVSVFFQFLLSALQILNHKVFACEFEVVSVVVYSLVLLQVCVIQDIVDDFTVDPENVPIVADLKVMT